ncbi:MAG: acyltransferase [Ferruginibacter sp.]|nr:acyltransferase [Ferruginibacter sp.]
MGRGCRFDIGPGATCILKKNTYISPFTNFIIMHSISIGENCIISWNCQFLDEDFHSVEYENKKYGEDKKIVIDDNVWIGCSVNVFKGTTIAKGCVVAANSVVRGVFAEENCLIAGNPAKVIKRNVNWK